MTKTPHIVSVPRDTFNRCFSESERRKGSKEFKYYLKNGIEIPEDDAALRMIRPGEYLHCVEFAKESDVVLFLLTYGGEMVDFS